MLLEDSVDELNSDVNAPTEGNGEEDFESHEMSMVRDAAMHSYHLDSVGEEIEVEPVNVDVVDEEETNYFTNGQHTLTQPAVTKRYDHPDHFTTLNLGAMRPDNSYHQRGLDDPTSEFEVGQQFDNKEAVLIAIKTYIWNWLSTEYTRFISLETRKMGSEEIQWLHSCVQSLIGQDHRRLDSKVISQAIFKLVQADPNIGIKVGLACKANGYCQDIWRLGRIL
ncbi:hypothetical protein PIB30_065864 [Stylosanthes scabra]|uniref:Uncharacterized protein n=1 Tax=Stylosanthes scabra TaxID=79078 RepID=A0ABU6QLM5_9FABA|nr:hypothetical protein [Stylosanthes scabra]